MNDKTRKSRKLPRWLRMEQVLKMFAYAKSDRDRILMKLYFYCGLRNNEALNLKKTDVDFTSGTIFIRQGKFSKDRYVPIPKMLENEMRLYMAGCEKEYLFKITDRHARRIIKGAAVAARIPDPFGIHPHTLRHSYATYLLGENVPLLIISKMLGHASLQATEIYTHLDMKKANEMINNVFTDVSKH